MSNEAPQLRLKSERPFRLVPAKNGRHQFGGACTINGIVPDGTDVPVQLVLQLDLTDDRVPVRSKLNLTRLPLLYPFKYGYGGPAIQYAVVSDTEIKILYMSHPQPDDADEQYLQLEELPRLSVDLIPLTYKQARILAFLETDGYFQPNKADSAILHDLDVDNLIRIGGRRDYIANAGDIYCHNPGCKFHERRIHFKCIAMVPPVPVNGDSSFWHEFDGDVEFCFGLCYRCGTVIAFNVAS